MLADDEPPAVEILQPGAPSPFLLLCDHASNRVPRALHDLGLDAAALLRHVAWDIGAAEVTRRLAARLEATALLSTYSRLVVDVNRPPEEESSMPAVSDEVEIPGNRDLDAAARQARLTACFHPYHEAVEALVAARQREGLVPVLVSIHSFTPVMAGFARPWQVGILWNRDDRLALPLIQALTARGFCVGDNEPYTGRDHRGYTLRRHAERFGLPHVLIEIRQDLIDTQHGAAEWADTLAPVLAERLVDPALQRRLAPA